MRYFYEPFGQTTALGTENNPFQYTGRENDSTGLYYYRARYYNPVLGRFLSEDPEGFEGDGPNFYVYVANNPINLIDPEGTQLISYLLYKAAGLLSKGSWVTGESLFAKWTSLHRLSQGLFTRLIPTNIQPIGPGTGLMARSRISAKPFKALKKIKIAARGAILVAGAIAWIEIGYRYGYMTRKERLREDMQTTQWQVVDWIERKTGVIESATNGLIWLGLY